ncbi:hypothetical protein, partial [Vibrio sp. 1180_3]|uniref:hypothetical protein n=1 Tax=Vibrio sp. 1180_3 TaxID=2528832 RepID=UPI002404F4E8
SISWNASKGEHAAIPISKSELKVNFKTVIEDPKEILPNAALSGEQRDHNPKPLRLKHKTQPRAEPPKRWESVLNA